MGDALPGPIELIGAASALLDQEQVGRRDAKLARWLLDAAVHQMTTAGERKRGHGDRLAALGASGDAELCARIIKGAYDDRVLELVAALRSDIADQLMTTSEEHRARQ